jgi:tetratricopeptide (TPR) repeat protein
VLGRSSKPDQTNAGTAFPEENMKIRIASTLLALMLPLAAQEPAANQEAIFYKAFYLEKGQKDFANAMVLYQQFLDVAPDHKLAKEAAEHQYGLLGTTGKTKERDAFKAKYEKLLGNAAPAPAAGDRPAGGAGDAPRGRGEGQGRPGGGAGGDMQARMAELEKQLAKAKEEGNTEEAKKLEDQIARMKQMAARGGAGGAGRGGVLFGTKKIAEMTDDEIKQLKEGVANSEQMIERMRERNPDGADKLSAGVANLKKALDANNKEDAQKALDAIREAMPRRGGRGGGGGGNGGGGGGGNGGGGGGGGNGGGGGGGNGGIR